MSLSPEIEKKNMSNLYENTLICIIWLTESYNQILHGYWWKFWSRDTDVTRLKPIIPIKNTKFRHLWVIVIFRFLPNTPFNFTLKKATIVKHNATI